MKLEENMYVRTKAGMIAKIISKEDVSGSLHKEEIVFILDNGNRLALHSQKVLKASHNIIDLIEVGDYVNGKLVTNANDVYTEDNIYIGKEVIVEHKDLIIEEDIETIVTKEQFKNMSYKVGE